MKLIPISEHPDAARILYQLLEERPASANISHRKMPTWEEHCEFVAFNSRPLEFEMRDGSVRRESYQAWYLVEVSDVVVGSVYLTHANEIGVSIFKKYQRGAHGWMSVLELMDLHGPRRYLANIAPGNESSRKMFEKLGFRLVQHTYALEAE